MPYTYSYPRPSVAVDVVVFCIDDNYILSYKNNRNIIHDNKENKSCQHCNNLNFEKNLNFDLTPNTCKSVIYFPPLEILLIKRKNEPYKDCYALPGGFIDELEETSKAATRELLEETNLHLEDLQPLFFASNPNRDPRGRCISLIYGALISKSYVNKKVKIRAGDDANEAAWFKINNLPPLAFDHFDIISDAIVHLKWQAENAIVGFRIISDFWTKDDINALHSIITNCYNNAYDRGCKLGLISCCNNKLEFKMSNTLKNWTILVW